jgi:succinoglycan biosynthesis protein ExoL
MPLKVAYLVHDLGDAAVARRVAGMTAGGAEVRLAGFYRRPPPAEVAGVRPVALGQTADARLAQRAVLVLSVAIRPQALVALIRGVDVIIARNLEMLVIAARLRQPGQRLIYECLDIHRVMLRKDAIGQAMRAIERRMLRQANLVLVSSPAFETAYFRRIQRHSGPVDLVENKVAALPATNAGLVPDEPWTIGWFGMLRCRRSLAVLSRLSSASAGRIRILIAGIPSPHEFPAFEDEIAGLVGVEFAGRYLPDDLPHLYGRVHFSWCVDYFEEGLNSSWLLPNRLYESIAHGAVPIALTHVETGRWLEQAGVGLIIEDDKALAPKLAAIGEVQYRALRKAVADLPRHRVALAPQDHQRIVARLAGSQAA